MEEEFVQNQEVLKPQEEKAQEERTKVDELRGSPMGVGTLEERIDENHAIVGSSVGPEYYVTIMSFVDKDLLEPGCSVLLHNKVRNPASLHSCRSRCVQIQCHLSSILLLSLAATVIFALSAMLCHIYATSIQDEGFIAFCCRLWLIIHSFLLVCRRCLSWVSSRTRWTRS